MCYFSSDAPNAGNRVSIQANLENEANSTKPPFEFILNVPSRFGRLDTYHACPSATVIAHLGEDSTAPQ
jgi:hypothetical protein